MSDDLIAKVAAAIHTYAIMQYGPHHTFAVYERAKGAGSKPIAKDMTRESATALRDRMNASQAICATEYPALVAMLRETVALYGKPGGPWNAPSDPGGWISRARALLAKIDGDGIGNAIVTIIQPRTLAEAEREAATWRNMGLEAEVVQDAASPEMVVYSERTRPAS